MPQVWPRSVGGPRGCTWFGWEPVASGGGAGQGLSYKLVADRLGMSLDTVRSHIRTIYQKLEVNSKAELMGRLQGR